MAATRVVAVAARGARDREPTYGWNEEVALVFDELTDELLDLRADVRGYGGAVYARDEDGGGGYCSCCCCCWGF